MQVGTIGRLYSLLKSRPKPVLLLGAGASIRSGIPGAAGVVERPLAGDMRISTAGPKKIPDCSEVTGCLGSSGNHGSIKTHHLLTTIQRLFNTCFNPVTLARNFS